MLATRMREAAFGVSTGETQYYLTFDGSSSSVDCGSDNSLDDLHDNALTVEAWVRFDIVSSIQGVVTKREGSQVGWAFYLDSSNNRMLAKIYSSGDDGETVSSINSISTSTWYHVAFTYDDATYTEPRVWLDGVEDTNIIRAKTGTVNSDATQKLFIGAFSASSLRLNGDIAWVRVSDNIRYTTGFTPDAKDAPPVVDGNTVEQWNLNDGSGTTADAEVSANNDGTITLGSGSWNAF